MNCVYSVLDVVIVAHYFLFSCVRKGSVVSGDFLLGTDDETDEFFAEFFALFTDDCVGFHFCGWMRKIKIIYLLTLNNKSIYIDLLFDAFFVLLSCGPFKGFSFAECFSNFSGREKIFGRDKSIGDVGRFNSLHNFFDVYPTLALLFMALLTSSLVPGTFEKSGSFELIFFWIFIFLLKNYFLLISRLLWFLFEKLHPWQQIIKKNVVSNIKEQKFYFKIFESNFLLFTFNSH